MTRDALYAVLAHNLGLSSREMAEVGGFSDRFARDLLAGNRPVPKDVQTALLEIQDDIDVLADSIEADVNEGQGVIWIFRTNTDLRAKFPQMPGRGQAAGGFIGPYRIAALTAWDALRDGGVDVDLLFAQIEL